MGKKKQPEPKFYVMDPTADETAQAFRPLNDHMSAFDGFPTLKQAVRYVLGAENRDDPWPPPNQEILDENGDAVEVDWEADEYKTREQLAKERDQAKAGTVLVRAGKLRAEKALLEHQKHLIDAGLIPAELLHQFIVSFDIKHNHHPVDFLGAGVMSVPMMQSVDATIRMAVPAPGTAGAYAFDKLLAVEFNR